MDLNKSRAMRETMEMFMHQHSICLQAIILNTTYETSSLINYVPSTTNALIGSNGNKELLDYLHVSEPIHESKHHSQLSPTLQIGNTYGMIDMSPTNSLNLKISSPTPPSIEVIVLVSLQQSNRI